jgi:uncharacterized membrane protein YjjP (DUF1212 family)
MFGRKPKKDEQTKAAEAQPGSKDRDLNRLFAIARRLVRRVEDLEHSVSTLRTQLNRIERNQYPRNRGNGKKLPPGIEAIVGPASSGVPDSPFP